MADLSFYAFRSDRDGEARRRETVKARPSERWWIEDDACPACPSNYTEARLGADGKTACLASHWHRDDCDATFATREDALEHEHVTCSGASCARASR